MTQLPKQIIWWLINTNNRPINRHIPYMPISAVLSVTSPRTVSQCFMGLLGANNIFEIYSPFSEQNDTHVRIAHMSIMYKPLNWSSINKISQGQLNFFQNLLHLCKRKKFNIWNSIHRRFKKKRNRKPTRKNQSSASGSLWAVIISTCDTLLTYTTLFKDGTHKHINKGLKEEYILWNKTFSAEYEFSYVQQIVWKKRHEKTDLPLRAAFGLS